MNTKVTQVGFISVAKNDDDTYIEATLHIEGDPEGGGVVASVFVPAYADPEVRAAFEQLSRAIGAAFVRYKNPEATSVNVVKVADAGGPLQ